MNEGMISVIDGSRGIMVVKVGDADICHHTRDSLLPCFLLPINTDDFFLDATEEVFSFCDTRQTKGDR